MFDLFHIFLCKICKSELDTGSLATRNRVLIRTWGDSGPVSDKLIRSQKFFTCSATERFVVFVLSCLRRYLYALLFTLVSFCRVDSSFFLSKRKI